LKWVFGNRLGTAIGCPLQNRKAEAAKLPEINESFAYAGSCQARRWDGAPMRFKNACHLQDITAE